MKKKEELYKLIISQLFYDGHQDAANAVCTAVKLPRTFPPCEKLYNLVQENLTVNSKSSNILDEGSSMSCIDLDNDPDASCVSPTPNVYETVYVTSHKAPCRAGAFSPNGSFIATGSVDASIKILDVERMIVKSTLSNQTDNNNQANNQDNQHSHPVIRTLYDHTEEVTYLQFHPTERILASGSSDMTIKFYDYSRANSKRSLKTIQEASPVRCFTFHPGGNYMLVGTHQPTIRLYDTNTCQCFVSCNPLDQHTGPVTKLDYNFNATMYTSSSKDGDIRVWDGLSNRCINVYRKAHDGTEISSVTFSKNGKYVLSAGKDDTVKLWELSMARCILTYSSGSSSSNKGTHRAQALFNHTEDYVMYPDCKTTTLKSWNSRNAVGLQQLSLCHNNTVRFITHSPVGPSFLTCSEDFRARFWSKRDKESKVE